MPKYCIPCSHVVAVNVYVEAENENEAKKIALEESPMDDYIFRNVNGFSYHVSDYVDDSFTVGDPEELFYEEEFEEKKEIVRKHNENF